MKTLPAPSHTLTIWIAGDLAMARQVCREFCMDVGLCVTVTPTIFIYTGGEESGAAVRLINYPRFPSSPAVLWNTAETLAALLRERLCQHSYSIEGPELTKWFSVRGEP